MDKKKENEIIKQMKKARSRFELKHILENTEQTQRICEEAIRINPYYLEYIKNQTPELCMMALQADLPYCWGYTPFRYIKEQTPELCMAAIKQEPCSIADVKEQTLELCMEAVSRNGLILDLIKNQTFNVCKAAVEKDDYALTYVRDPKIRKEIEKELKPHLNELLHNISTSRKENESKTKRNISKYR